MNQASLLPARMPSAQFFQHLPSYRTFSAGENQQALAGEVRKKIQNYSFLLTDKIGKGYSSTVYKGLDDLTGKIEDI